MSLLISKVDTEGTVVTSGRDPSPVFALKLGNELPLLLVGVQVSGRLRGDPLQLSLSVKTKQETSDDVTRSFYLVLIRRTWQQEQSPGGENPPH